MRIGVVGTGWGRMHVGAFRGAGAEVVAICGRDPGKTRAIADREQIEHATTDVATLADLVDAVVIASPDALHLEHVRIVLGRGRPMLCEKPLARTEAEAAEMLVLARASGLACAVAFPYRMLPPLGALADWLHDRQPREIIATIRNGFAPAASDRPRDDLLDASGDFGGASHVIDAALWLSGGRGLSGAQRGAGDRSAGDRSEEPGWVQASLSGRPVRSAALHVGTGDGMTIVITHASSPESGIHGGWSILGDRWEAGFSAGYIPARGGWCVSDVRAYEHGEWRSIAPGVEPRVGEREPWALAHVETARAFLSAIDGTWPARLARFEEGLRVQRILGAALRSHEERRRVAIAPPTAFDASPPIRASLLRSSCTDDR